jgi:general secretion pathway protein B
VAAPSTPATVTPVTPSIAPPAAAAPPPARTVASAPPASANPRAALPEIPATFSTSAPAVEAPAEEALPTLAVLDSITRGTLPPLKLSMHVWGQEPGKRFAIVDGQRVAEGSLLGNGVVEQIRRDGVVINVNGQRLLLPKP